MSADIPDDEVKSRTPPAAPTPAAPAAPAPVDLVAEREMRDAEERALAESGLGSGLLARQPMLPTGERPAVHKVCPQCGNEYETSARFCPSDGTSLRPKGSDSLIGRVMAERYHILKRIGEGGMGRVYLGEHVKMNRQCAIKVMSPALVNDHESAARFAREASNAARIIHPNVAAVFDYGESEGLVYLVMEYVEGEPLARILAREAPLPVERALDLARQIADGLGAAHELGIVHRDLKPDNILIARSKAGKEVAKVVDFGIAKAIQENAGDALTRTGLVIGTPEFMSPEQLLGDPIDARSDLYALGCIMHLMLTASPPFSAPTREQMIKRRLSEEAPHIQHLDPALPDSLDRIVNRLLSRSPAQRYGSAGEVREALAGTHARRQDVAGFAHGAVPTPRSAPTQAFEAAALAPTEQTELSRRPLQRRAMIAAGAVVLLVTAIVVRGSGDGDDAGTTAGASKSGAATSPAPARRAVTPPIIAPRKSVVVDSATRAKRLAERQRRDSMRALTKAASVAARSAAVAPGSLAGAIARYTRAIEAKSVDMLKEAYPGLTEDQQKFWETNVFSRATRIKAQVVDLKTTTDGDAAEADFRLNVTFDYGDAQRGSIGPQQQHAKLTRTGSGWQIVSIR
ncbi:MAG TPA: serine/threonine-protein kinase [Gemmatimonadaceae bacterium]|nr:serine/threonine-protein kinase [Gemmatimonadaceae bacterium]